MPDTWVLKVETDQSTAQVITVLVLCCINADDYSEPFVFNDQPGHDPDLTVRNGVWATADLIERGSLVLVNSLVAIRAFHTVYGVTVGPVTDIQVAERKRYPGQKVSLDAASARLGLTRENYRSSVWNKKLQEHCIEDAKLIAAVYFDQIGQC